jgi:hypothetical protein
MPLACNGSTVTTVFFRSKASAAVVHATNVGATSLALFPAIISACYSFRDSVNLACF